VLVRRERPGDEPAIHRVHAAAFRGPDPAAAEPEEAGLVDRLRASDAWLPALSLVALVDGEIVGHVVCTRAWLDPSENQVLGLAPIGVDPTRQRQGIGSALMHAVLAAADALDEPLVGLVGEPEYYGRFGFEPASHHAIAAPDPAWGEYFQVRTLAAYRGSLSGSFRYAEAFGLDTAPP
jgi:putative acetyltransferase